MYKYKLWVRIDAYVTVDTYVWADYDWQAKAIGEAKFGVGNVLNYTRVN